MGMMTNKGIPGIPVQDLHGIDLDPRYEIRILTEDTTLWVSALIFHGNAFHNPIWGSVYKGTATKLCSQNLAIPECVALYRRLITEGISFGVFDTQYVFKRPESAATGGAVYWDEIDLTDPDLESGGEEKLLEAMDFPLLSVSMGYDQGALKDSPPSFAGMFPYWPLRKELMTHMASFDPRPRGSWEATESGKALMRLGTYTRRDYGGIGLMGKLAQFVVLEAAARGFAGIQIPCGNDAVYRRYMNPRTSAGKGHLVYEAKFKKIEVEGDNGKTSKPFEECTVDSVKFVWVDLVAK
jgi:hypothetical protein